MPETTVKVRKAPTPSARTQKQRSRLTMPQLTLHYSERRILLALVDVLALSLALWLSLRWGSDIPNLLFLPERWQLTWLPVLIVLWFIVASLLNVYDLAKAASTMHSLWASGTAALLTAGLYLLIPYITPPLPERRLALLLFPLLAALGVATWRLFYATVFIQPVFHQTALVVGAGWSGRTLAQAIVETGDGNGNPYHGTGYRLLGFIDDDPNKQGLKVDGVPVLGTRHDLMRLVRELQPNELVVAITHSRLIHAELFQAILDCREQGISVITMASLYERMTGKVPVEHAGRDLHVVFSVQRPPGYRLYLAFRRLLDIAVALVGSLALAALVPFIWLINRFISPGDIFYRQTRVGKGGRLFQVLKFRSMAMDAEKDTGAVWAQENDDRVTPSGRILRKTRLDEVPQFWNVLKGDMSLIGPRPERPEFVQELAEQIPFYRVRHAVKPGITGWAQVKYRYGASVKDSLVKLQYDLYYIKHQGPFLDLLILLKTVQVVLGMAGR